MKKLGFLLSSIVLASVAAFLVSSKPNESISEAYSRVLPKIDFQSTKIESKNWNDPQLVMQSNNLAKKSNDKLKKETSELIDCIDTQKCLNRSERFYDPKSDPVYTQLRKKLEFISLKAQQDPRFLEEIDSSMLKRVLNYKHPSSFAIALELLLQKNIMNAKYLENIKFTGSEVQLFTDLFSNQVISDNGELRDFRNDQLAGFIQGDNHTLLNTLKNMNYLEFSMEEVRDIKDKSCKRIQQVKSFQRIYIKHLSKLTRKYGLNSQC